jgi:hypothetical protein
MTVEQPRKELEDFPKDEIRELLRAATKRVQIARVDMRGGEYMRVTERDQIIRRLHQKNREASGLQARFRSYIYKAGGGAPEDTRSAKLREEAENIRKSLSDSGITILFADEPVSVEQLLVNYLQGMSFIPNLAEDKFRHVVGANTLSGRADLAAYQGNFLLWQIPHVGDVIRRAAAPGDVSKQIEDNIEALLDKSGSTLEFTARSVHLEIANIDRLSVPLHVSTKFGTWSNQAEKIALIKRSMTPQALLVPGPLY